MDEMMAALGDWLWMRPEVNGVEEGCIHPTLKSQLTAAEAGTVLDFDRINEMIGSRRLCKDLMPSETGRETEPDYIINSMKIVSLPDSTHSTLSSISLPFSFSPLFPFSLPSPHSKTPGLFTYMYVRAHKPSEYGILFFWHKPSCQYLLSCVTKLNLYYFAHFKIVALNGICTCISSESMNTGTWVCGFTTSSPSDSRLKFNLWKVLHK